MRNSMNHCAVVAVILSLLILKCDKSGTNPPEKKYPEKEGDIILAAPYADVIEFKYIHPGFSVSADSGAPWGFAHLGLDLIVAKDSAHVIAPADGIVEEIYIYQNERNFEWQVNLRICYNSRYVYHLLFEPRAHSRKEVEPQRSAIPLAVGQRVHQGDSFGVIYDLAEGDHTTGGATVHFDIWKDNQNTCPAPYFTAEAYAGMLSLLRAMYPGAELCYP